VSPDIIETAKNLVVKLSKEKQDKNVLDKIRWQLFFIHKTGTKVAFDSYFTMLAAEQIFFKKSNKYIGYPNPDHDWILVQFGRWFRIRVLESGS
jgi:hypothetical protein